MNKIYLDNAATKPLSDKMKEYLKDIIDNYYANPSSMYEDGRKSKILIEETREKVAKFINADKNNIIFTCGGSASNTLGIQGYKNTYEGEKPLLCYYLSIAHKSLRMQFENGNYIKIPIYHNGMISHFALKEEFEKYNQFKPFVCIEYANSEIGTIQEVKKVSKLVHEFNGIIYVDCTGSISSIPLDVQDLDVDIAGFSGHKIGALKGIGVLYKKESINLKPLIYGKQEQGLFGGTENILGIASLGKAVEDYKYSDNAKRNRDYVERILHKNAPHSFIMNKNLENRLPNNLFICFPEIRGEYVVGVLNENGIQISTGSACNNGEQTPPRVLTEIGLSKNLNDFIRITFSGNETKEQLDTFCDTLISCERLLRIIVKEY